MALPKAQKLSKDISEKFKDGSNPFLMCTHLLEECGEAATQVKGLEGKKPKSKMHFSKEELGKELVDIIHNALCLANKYNINVDAIYEKRVNEYLKKV